jgi:pimeloyl-ACP methyl ester carboxylesterase
MFLSGALTAQTNVHRCDGAAPKEQLTGPLVVIVPGMGSTTDDWDDMIHYFRSEASLGIGNSPFLCFDHGLRATSRKNLLDVSRDLASSIDAEWRILGGDREVIIVAHSFGALLARAAYLIAGRQLAGDNTDEQPWHSKVKRFVLFAGIGRGVQRNPLIQAADKLIQVATPIGFDDLVGQQILRGSPFVTNLRLSTIADLAAPPTAHDRPLFVQLLGTQDGIVKQDDNIDLCVMGRIAQLSVPLATHGDVIQIGWTDNDEARRTKIREAFAITDPSQSPEQAASPCISEPNDTLPIVVMLHGIRSNPWAWQGGIARELEGAGIPSDHVVRPNYGYFTLLDFIRRHSRDAEIPTVLDELVQARARYPNAPINVVAHSFGTYILGHALLATPAFRADRVFLVGSMLPEGFSWDEINRRGQANKIYSISGNKDLPVSLASAAVSGVPFNNVGAGGFRGFMGTSVVRCNYVDGGHSAPFDGQARIALMSQFLANKAARPCEVNSQSEPPETLQLISRAAPGIGLAATGSAIWVSSKYVADGRNPRDRWRHAGYVGISLVGLQYLLSIF